MNRGLGESDLFDQDGSLWHAELAPREAIEMVRILVRGIPQLRKKGGFSVEIASNLPHAGITEVLIDHRKRIVAVHKMSLAVGDLNEHVVIHELAHIAADTMHGNIKDPHCGHGIGFRTWCSILEQYWRAIKAERGVYGKTKGF